MIDVPLNPVVTRESAAVVFGVIAAQIIGGLFAQMSPFVVAGMMDGLGLSERDAGIVAAVELLFLAVTAITVAPVLPWLPNRLVCLFAVGLTLLAQAASFFVEQWLGLVALRGLSGIGEGALYALSLSVVAYHFRNPERVFGYLQVVWALGSIPLFIVAGEVTAAFAHRGIIALLCALTLVLAPLLLLVPNCPPLQRRKAGRDSGTLVPLQGALLLMAIFLYVAVSAALYAFSAPIGARAGLDTAAVGYTLTLASLVGFVGAGASTVLNLRWGRVIPIAASFIGYVLVALALCLWQNATAFAVALVGSVVLYYFSMPYLFGLTAAIDRAGRWAAAAGSAYLLGFAAGPLAGGAVIAAAGYQPLAAICVGAIAGAGALVMVVVTQGLEGRAENLVASGPSPSED